MCWLARARKTNVKNARTQMMRFLENLQFKNAVKKKERKFCLIMISNHARSRSTLFVRTWRAGHNNM